MTKPGAHRAGLVLAAALAATAHAAPDAAPVATGGIGLEERAALDAVRERYNLRIAFAEADGDYVAGVRVTLSAAADGTVHYAGETEGPFLFVRLAPGRYRMQASYAGLAQERLLEVGASQPQPYVYVRWPDGAAPAGGRG